MCAKKIMFELENGKESQDKLVSLVECSIVESIQNLDIFLAARAAQ